MCLFVLVCVVLLVASVLASVRWLLCGGDGSKNEKKKNDVCNFKKMSRERILSPLRFLLVRKILNRIELQSSPF